MVLRPLQEARGGRRWLTANLRPQRAALRLLPPPAGDVPSVLILFSDTGGGHRASAKAVESALRTLDPSVQVNFADPLIGDGRKLVRRVCSMYPSLIQGTGRAWGAIWHTTNTRVSFAAVRAALRTQVSSVITSQIATHDPDLVLSVHPLLNHVTSSVLRRGGRDRGLVTVITDLVEIHRGWIDPRADLVVTPTAEASRTVLRAVPPERVRPLGLPVDLRFRPAEPGEQQALRRRWGLDPNRPTVLVLGGGEGSGRLEEQVRALAAGHHPWQVVAVCGRNEKLRRKLTQLPFGTLRTPTLVLGFVDDMADRMRAADLVVTKAGPGTIAESLASGVPLVLTGHVPGQETANLGFVASSGVGVLAPQTPRLRAEIESLLVADRPRYAEMKQRALATARSAVAIDIGNECLELARRYRKAGCRT